jgi:hypothetical protein
MGSTSQSFIRESLVIWRMHAFLNKHPVESVYGKFESVEFTFPLVDLVVSTYGNTSKVDLKIDTLMSLPSIEKENYGTVYMIITYQPHFTPLHDIL